MLHEHGDPCYPNEVEIHKLELKSTMQIVTTYEPSTLNEPEVMLCAYMLSIGARTFLLQLEWKFGAKDRGVDVPFLPMFYHDHILQTMIANVVVPLLRQVFQPRETCSLPAVVHAFAFARKRYDRSILTGMT